MKSGPVSKLISELSRLPSIGEKTATRLAYFILKEPSSYAQALSQAILHAKKTISLCSECFQFTEIDPCSICKNPMRDHTLLCIVEHPSNVFYIEQTRTYQGLYHVLHGVLSPLDEIGPQELKIQELLNRLKTSSQKFHEIVFAINPSIEGETTVTYLVNLLKPLGIKLSQLAHGIPAGGLLEYTDRKTIEKALSNRTEMS